jgi:hypothetical protein
MDGRKIIFGLMVIVFLLVVFFPVSGNYVSKKCEYDSDCAFVRTKCCPGCEGGFAAVNKNSADKLNPEMDVKCNSTECQPLFCENSFGAGYMAKPRCYNSQCKVNYELQCTAVCSYYTQNLKAPYKLYLISIAELENTTILKLVDKCGC